MTDKEIGELWKRSQRVTVVYKHELFPDAEDVSALIRKLVEERALALYHRENPMVPWKDDAKIYRWAIESALRDFGIDPAIWPKE